MDERGMWSENYSFVIHVHKTAKELLKAHLMISLEHAFLMGSKVVCNLLLMKNLFAR